MRHWPDTLPTPIGPGYQLTVVDQHLRTDMEVGPARTRRLTRARRDQVQAVWVMDPYQFDAFRGWFEDLPWSLAGHSDYLAHWTGTRAAWGPSASLTPDNVIAGRIVETAETGTHIFALPVPALAGQTSIFTASIRAAGRTFARVGLVDGTGATAKVDVDLTTGTGSHAAGLLSWSVTDRGQGWWRVVIRAAVAAGGQPPQAMIQTLTAAGGGSHAGNVLLGLDAAEVNVRIATGSDLYLPTDDDGRARGAAGGAAWAMIPVWTGGVLTPVETRFERTFSVEVKSGLNTHVSAPLEVRYA